MALNQLNPNISIKVSVAGAQQEVLGSPRVLPNGALPTDQDVCENVNFHRAVKRQQDNSGAAIVTDRALAEAARNEHRVLDAATVQHGQVQQTLQQVQLSLQQLQQTVQQVQQTVQQVQQTRAQHTRMPEKNEAAQDNQLARLSNAFVHYGTDVIKPLKVVSSIGSQPIGTLPSYAGGQGANAIFPKTLAALRELRVQDLVALRGFYGEDVGWGQQDTRDVRITKLQA